jgi:hypothetical protein
LLVNTFEKTPKGFELKDVPVLEAHDNMHNRAVHSEPLNKRAFTAGSVKDFD